MSRLLLIFLLNYFLFLQDSQALVSQQQSFSPIPINDETEKIATSILNHIKPFFDAGNDCELSLNQVYHAESRKLPKNVVYKFDLKITGRGFYCGTLTKTCISIKIMAPFPMTCTDDPFQPCFTLIDEDDILCIPDLTTVEPSDNPVEFKEIFTPVSNPIIQNIARESTKFLYHLFNTTKPCPLHLAEIISVKEQTLNGITYELEVQVETNGADFECEYVIKQCNKLRVHQPLPSHCPFGRQFCLVPVNLKDVSCTEISALVY